MTKFAHRLYITLLSLIVLFCLVILIQNGISYYDTLLEERFFHADHESLKPSGTIGHGLGVAGSFLMLIGVVSYMTRKRWRRIGRVGLLKHWLEFHIFLCTLGPILVLFHTAFKFGGLVAISFWSMVAVFLSGIIGRFIYIQIPRTIEGREMSLNEVKEMKADIGTVISNSYSLDDESYQVIIDSTRSNVHEEKQGTANRFFKNYLEDKRKIRKIRKALKNSSLSRTEYNNVIKLIRNELSLNRRIGRLVLMQNLFRYWHVAHLPFALVMLIIMIIHVGVTIALGYKWIF